MKLTDKIEVHRMDCMEYLKGLENNAFELAIVDPPYGIGMDGGAIGKGKALDKKEWDSNRPPLEYFLEISRVSQNAIVWGGNYFSDMLPPTKSWIYWDKMQDGFGKTFSSGELAWTSFNFPMKQIRYKWQGNYCGFEKNITTKTAQSYKKIHPTQKPVNLYRWIISKYAQEGDRILDTHLGSMSIAIACHMEGFELVGCELDQDYFDSGVKRFQQVTAQQDLFLETQ